MNKCASCAEDFTDGPQCSVCLGRFDYVCAGVTEHGFRGLGENRKAAWRCSSCKIGRTPSPLPPPANPPSLKLPVPADMDAVLAELKRLSLLVAVLPGLDEAVKNIKAELSTLKTIKPEIADIKSSLEFIGHKMGALSDKILGMEKDIKTLQKTKHDVEYLQLRVEKLEAQNQEVEQRSRLNNLEIKGVPVSNNENLFEVVSKIGMHVKCAIPKEQINYIARIPVRDSKAIKTIVVAIHSRYIKDEFVSVARKCTITATALGMSGSSRIFVNEHLTIVNKILLNKIKALAKDKGFAFVWVRGCKIFVRKNEGSPKIQIRTEADLGKL